MEKKQITWRSWWNGPEGTRGPLSESWNIQGWPTIYVLDSKGVIRYKHFGNNEVKELDEVVDGLVKELEGETK